MTSIEHSSTTPPEKAGTQCTTTNHYPHWVQVPTTMRYHHGNHNHGRKVQLPLHNHKSKNSGDQPTPQPAGHTPRRPMPGTFRDSGPSSLK
ncbi:hypothetical protein Taro_052239 [Colocasia esculenta]|uniref:Uncharacterized protein n=1 Tax=Colocasia esculenta TaxID=4460 RepID=A0A843XI29_COLES|nr:hypothetical protein [Colocasia esculenta]